MKRGLAVGLGLSVLLIASSTIAAEEPKPGSRVEEALRRILTPNQESLVQPPATPTETVPVRLVPAQNRGTVTNRFSLDAAATIPPANANVQMVSVPNNPAYSLEIGVEVAMDGVSTVVFDCQLNEVEIWRGSRDGRSTRVRAVNRLVHPVNGPFSGRLLMGFAPFEPVSPIDMYGNPIRYPEVVCRMEASGSALGSTWSTHIVHGGITSGAYRGPEYLGLFDQGTGRRLQSQLLVTRAATILIAVPEEVNTAYN